MSTVEIFPPFGIARVGNSEEYYISSEDPEHEHSTDFHFRDASGKLRRSAVKFHAYGYHDGKPTEEIKQQDGLCVLEWTVHVANAKAFGRIFMSKFDKDRTTTLRNAKVTQDREKKLLIQASGTISGRNKGPVPLVGNFKGSTNNNASVTLGTLYTDDNGCLIFVAGTGDAQCVLEPNNSHPDLTSQFDNDDWFDTVCDGDVSVKVNYAGSNPRIINSSLRTVVSSAPPKFTSGIHCFSSLHDLIEDIYERPKRLNHGYDCGKVYYVSDIKPILDAPKTVAWTNPQAYSKHGPGKIADFDHKILSDNSSASKAAREHIFKYVRVPVKAGNDTTRDSQASEQYMPQLSGDAGDQSEHQRDTWASLTELQYDRLTKWKNGDFDSGSRPMGPTDKLTLATLKWTTGAPLYPGIETFWMASLTETYNMAVPFRFQENIKPGDVTKGLSLPWQSDFYMCNTHWWPHVRPDSVLSWQRFQRLDGGFPDSLDDVWAEGLDSTTEMVKKWTGLGFISPAKSNSAVFVETDRTLWLRGGKYTVSNVAYKKFVATSGSGSDTRPIAGIGSPVTWNLKHIKNRVYQLKISDFTAAPQASEVYGYKTPSNPEATNWVLKPSKNDTYTIETPETSGHPPKVWTLANGNDGTIVSLTDKADNDNQRWILNPTKASNPIQRGLWRL